ncbi:MAG: hypothetical protein ACRD4B_08490 [Acidobacteriota bacterium]
MPPSQPSSPVSGGKETTPIANASESQSPEPEAQAVGERTAVVESAERNGEVDKVVEKSPDQETPNIPKVVQQAGVTHSGPGLVMDAIDENVWGVSKMPISYQQAALEEHQTKMKESKHWLMATVMYVWRKLNPQYGTKEGAKEMKDEK